MVVRFMGRRRGGGGGSCSGEKQDGLDSTKEMGLLTIIAGWKAARVRSGNERYSSLNCRYHKVHWNMLDYQPCHRRSGVNSICVYPRNVATAHFALV